MVESANADIDEAELDEMTNQMLKGIGREVPTFNLILYY
jgi:hypothetical protein